RSTLGASPSGCSSGRKGWISAVTGCAASAYAREIKVAGGEDTDWFTLAYAHGGAALAILLGGSCCSRLARAAEHDAACSPACKRTQPADDRQQHGRTEAFEETIARDLAFKTSGTVEADSRRGKIDRCSVGPDETRPDD